MTMAKFLWIAALVFAADCRGQSGPDADAYGSAEQYPVGTAQTFFQQKYMVGSFSHFDSIFRSDRIAPASKEWEFGRGSLPPALADRVDDYVKQAPLTGLLIGKDDQILFERYQYDRKPADLFTSQSMSKTFVAMMAGTALGAKALDNSVETYVPELKGSAYGAVKLENLLHMMSGIDCDIPEGELDGNSLKAIESRCKESVPQGTRFRYSGNDAQVLGFAVSSAAHASLAKYLQDTIWERIGTQEKASWAVDGAGRVDAYCCLNASLRDYARFARLLAFDGNWNGTQLIPKDWIERATTVPDSDALLQPGKPAPFYGYGYQTWIFPGPGRRFALLGANGQRIFVDPEARLYMVETAVTVDPVDLNRDAQAIRLWFALVHRFKSR